MGPMVAARRFAVWLEEHGLLTQTAHVEADLYGSLALTGKGHAADTAVVAGLAGEIPASTSFAAIKAHPSVVPAADPESHVRPDEQVSWRDVEARLDRRAEARRRVKAGIAGRA